MFQQMDGAPLNYDDQIRDTFFKTVTSIASLGESTSKVVDAFRVVVDTAVNDCTNSANELLKYQKNPPPTIVATTNQLKRTRAGGAVADVERAERIISSREYELECKVKGGTSRVDKDKDGEPTRYRGLNTVQRVLYDQCELHAVAFYEWRKQNNSTDGGVLVRPANIRLMIIGGPGTGKTFVIDCITEKYRLEKLKAFGNIETSAHKSSIMADVDAVIVSAPTAVAAQLYETGTINLFS
jgi:Cdc6-like AAA superfamily ATPase